MSRLSFRDTFSITLAISLALGIVLSIFYPVFRSMHADGKVTFCYVSTDEYRVPSNMTTVTYNVWGHREWRGDWLIGRNLLSLEEAKSTAKLYGCELK